MECCSRRSSWPCCWHRRPRIPTSRYRVQRVFTLAGLASLSVAYAYNVRFLPDYFVHKQLEDFVPGIVFRAARTTHLLGATGWLLDRGAGRIGADGRRRLRSAQVHSAGARQLPRGVLACDVRRRDRGHAGCAARGTRVGLGRRARAVGAGCARARGGWHRPARHAAEPLPRRTDCLAVAARDRELFDPVRDPLPAPAQRAVLPLYRSLSLQ